MKKIYLLESKTSLSEAADDLTQKPDAEVTVKVTDVTKPMNIWYKVKAFINAFGDASPYFVVSIYLTIYAFILNFKPNLPDLVSLELALSIFAILVSLFDLFKAIFKLKTNQAVFSIFSLGVSLIVMVLNVKFFHVNDISFVEKASWAFWLPTLLQSFAVCFSKNMINTLKTILIYN